MTDTARGERIDRLRARIGRIEQRGRTAAVLPFGLAAIDRALPGGGLAMGALHEVAAASRELADEAAAVLFVAGIAARLAGPVIWCVRYRDLFAPGLSQVGLATSRLIHAEAGSDADILTAMEEALAHGGPACVIGEMARLPMASARRLQLAATASGTVALALRRHAGPTAFFDPSPAVTRWRLAALPTAPLPFPGIGRARWRLDLTRVRGAEPKSWIVEGCDAQGCLALAADLADRQTPAASERAA